MTTTTTLLTDARLVVGGCDLSWQNNQVEIVTDLDEKDATTFRSGGWKEVRGSLTKGSLKAEGLAALSDQPGTQDYDAWARLGQVDALSVSAGEIEAGGTVLLTRLLRAKYSLGGKVGELLPWSMDGSSSWPLVRGVWLAGPGTAITGDGSSTPVQCGAMAAGQRLYAAVHVISVAGATPTIDVTITSDSAEAFSSPTTRLTFAQATAAGGQILRTTAGAHADTWYRAQWDISASGGESFLAAISIGIL